MIFVVKWESRFDVMRVLAEIGFSAECTPVRSSGGTELATIKAAQAPPQPMKGNDETADCDLPDLVTPMFEKSIAWLKDYADLNEPQSWRDKPPLL